MRGYVQVYTGNGKGKTTAALGLAMRAVGSGLKVFIAQFMKGIDYSELHVMDRFKGDIVLKQYGRNCFVYDTSDELDINIAQNGFEASRHALLSGNYDVIIMDEANIAVHYNLLTIEQLLSLIDKRPENVELVLTGRYATSQIIERADLVTEMNEIKHYFQNGVNARPGIES
jgi:cob(I)alamin adenosyltransferase